jgi:tetratricopeptide (TPR) repeat protein
MLFTMVQRQPGEPLKHYRSPLLPSDRRPNLAKARRACSVRTAPAPPRERSASTARASAVPTCSRISTARRLRNSSPERTVLAFWVSACRRRCASREHVGRREWGKAVACYAQRLELVPTDDGELWFEYAASQLLAGDRPGYGRACAHMLARCQASKVRSYLAARVCTLAPDSADDPELPGRLSQGELQGSKNEFWSLTEQAALHVRAGRIQEATPPLEVSLRIDGRPARAVLNWLWLALAYQKQGKAAEARRWLDKAANWLDQQGGQMPLEITLMGGHRHNWLEAHVLRREAEALIQPAEKR